MAKRARESRNLLDESTLVKGYYIYYNNSIVIYQPSADSPSYRSFRQSFVPGTYTISFGRNVYLARVICDGVMSENVAISTSSYTITTQTGDIGFSVRPAESSSTPWDNNPTMLNSGSTALPYEPYGTTIWEPCAVKQYHVSKTTERTDTLPITINADGSTLADYRIYGASGGVGDDSGTEYGYVLPMSVSDGTTSTTMPIYIGSDPLGEDEYVDYGEGKVYRRTNNIFPYAKAGTFAFGNAALASDGEGNFFINGNVAKNVISPKMLLEHDFTIPVAKDNGGTGVWCLGNEKPINAAMILYDANGSTIEIWNLYPQNRISTAYTNMAGSVVHAFAFRSLTDISISDTTVSPMMINDGEIPAQYIPYLQPTDPPVPLPEIPTADGTTIIDYNGTPKPSQMYVKYNSGSRWEPCTEYVRRNGVWVPNT